MTTLLELTCRDPLVARDGRPFGAGLGNRMRSAGWLLPSVIAGAVRTAAGNAERKEFSTDTAAELLQMAVAGVLPVADGRLYLPSPRDCVVEQRKDGERTVHKIHRAEPEPTPRDSKNECDIPEGLRPVMLSEGDAPDEFKPREAPVWWPIDRYADWLVVGRLPSGAFDESFLNAPERDERTHVRLDPQTGTADEGLLFTTASLSLTHLRRYGDHASAPWSKQYAEITLSARVRANGWCGEAVARLDGLHPMGGERRLLHWSSRGAVDLWKCPPAVSDALAEAKHVRMVLATPAIFQGGWKPGWLDERLVGSPPGSSVVLRLVGVSIDRWRAVSGWSYQPHPETGKPGPKPIRRIVPAGGVYFFEVESGAPAELAGRWLEPVSDDEQEQRDGFGLAVWGTR